MVRPTRPWPKVKPRKQPAPIYHSYRQPNSVHLAKPENIVHRPNRQLSLEGTRPGKKSWWQRLMLWIKS